MTNNISDVLRYLIKDDDEFYIGRTVVEQKNVVDQLQQIGFDKNTIDQAFFWIQNLTFLGQLDAGDVVSDHQDSECEESDQLGVRYYVDEETQHLPVIIRSYIMSLEQAGMLDTVAREMVIHQLMFLEAETIDLDLVKWVIRVVLKHYPADLGLTRLEESMLAENAYQNLH